MGAGGWFGADGLASQSALVRVNALSAPPGDYDPMLKIKDLGGSSNKQSSVMFNVMTHVPSHQYFCNRINYNTKTACSFNYPVNFTLIAQW